MAKTIDIRTEQGNGDSIKKIEFTRGIAFLAVGGEPYTFPPARKPHSFDKVYLLKKRSNGEDLMFAIDEHAPNGGCLYLGNWNSDIA